MPSMKYFLATIDGKRTLIDYAKDIPKGVEAAEIEIKTDKVGLREAIQELLTEADEAKDVPDIPEATEEFFQEAKVTLPTYSGRIDYGTWSVNLDDAWGKLPLARKLHFAASAVEEAREALPQKVQDQAS